MERWEIEAKLGRDRAWLLETYAALSEGERTRPATPSEHDPESMWCALDHLVHVACIERDFNRMIRRHVAGEVRPVGLFEKDDGTRRTLEEVMVDVHALTEGWTREHRGKTFSEVVAFGETVRAETLALLGELTDAQIAGKVPGAPWADGTVGGMIALHGDHARMHFRWVTEGWETLGAAGKGLPA